jgi:hypothetical protein
MAGIALACGAAALAAGPVGAAGYDNSNPSSTGCVNKGQVAVSGSAKSYLGVWTVELRRSTGCNTVWARVIRTDGKKCRSSGQYCARIQLQRVRADGTVAKTNWRRQPNGTTRHVSFQFDVLTGATYTGTITNAGGTKIGATAAVKL